MCLGVALAHSRSKPVETGTSSIKQMVWKA